MMEHLRKKYIYLVQYLNSSQKSSAVRIVSSHFLTADLEIQLPTFSDDLPQFSH